MVVKKGAGLKKVKVDIGPFLDPPAENVFITFSGPTVGEYNDLMASQMELAKEDPNGIEFDVPVAEGSTETKKMKVSTASAKKRTDFFNALISKHILDHDLEKEGDSGIPAKMTDAEVWQLVLGNVDMDEEIIGKWNAALPLQKISAAKPSS